MIRQTIKEDSAGDGSCRFLRLAADWILLDRDPNFWGDYRFVVRDVEIIPQHKLEGVSAGLQSERGFRLAFSEVKNLFRGFQRFVEVGQFVHIHEKVVMASVFEFDSGGSDSHSLQTEFDGECFSDLFAVSRRDNVNFCAGRGFGLRQFQRSELLLAGKGADCQR